MFMLNYCWEGTSYLEYNFWEMLTCSALRYNIPLEKIFFITSNLKDEEQYDAWQKMNYPNDRINVISFNYFAQYTSNYLHHVKISIDQTVENIKEDQKLFLSLNRRIRPYRVYTIYKIFQSRFFDNTMISYDKIRKWDIQRRYEGRELARFVDETVLNNLINSSPKVLDFSDFTENWACSPFEAAVPNQLFNKSMISLVSETHFETENSSSLFLSEKTFKPMLYNHPIMIFGQPQLNTALEQVGFKTYSKYFDINFDHTEDHVTRIDMQIAQLEVLNDKLSSMTVSQKVDWLLQGRDILEHNKEALYAQDFNKKKLAVLSGIVQTITE
jgi:hypothetical protein